MDWVPKIKFSVSQNLRNFLKRGLFNKKMGVYPLVNPKIWHFILPGAFNKYWCTHKTPLSEPGFSEIFNLMNLDSI